MTINLCTVSDKVFEADGTIPPFASVRFELIGWDADKNTAGTSIVAPETILADVNDLTGVFSVDLWQNGAGIRATYYKVSLLRYTTVSKNNRPQVTELGKIQIASGQTSADMSSLLSEPILNESKLEELEGILEALKFTINEQTADYTLALSDSANVVEMNVATANTLTVPDNDTVNFLTGTHVIVYQTGIGQTTISPAVGVTIHMTTGISEAKVAQQWGTMALFKRAPNEWVLTGDLT